MFAVVYRAANRRFAPWKNGGGETAEIVCFPQGAGFDSFGWRISTARVAQDGPFSRFDGVARSLTVIDGGPMTLMFSDGHVVVLDRSAPPFGFDGGLGCDAVLSGDAVLDLNVMARAPNGCSVTRGHVPDVNCATVARFVFACVDMPEHGLAQHDLAQLADGADWPPDRAGIVYIAIHSSP